MRKGPLLALAAMGALAGIGAVTLGLIANQWVTTQLARYVLDRLDAQIPVDIRFESVSVRPLTCVISVDDLALALPGKPKEPLARANQAIIDLDLLALLTGKVQINRLHLVNPEMTIVHRDSNRYNVEDLLPGPQPEVPGLGGSPVSLRRVTAEGGRLTYRDDPRGLLGELPQLDVNLTIDATTGKYAGRVTLARGWLKRGKLEYPIDSFCLDFAKRESVVKIKELKLDAGPTSLAARGRVDGLDTRDPRFAVDGIIETDLASYASAPELAELDLAGRAKVDWRLSGTARDPRVAVRLTGDGLRSRAMTVLHLTVALLATRRGIQIDDARATLFGGQVQGRGTVPLVKEGRLDARLAVDDIDLAMAVRALGLRGDVAGVTGRASARLTASGAGANPAAYAASGWLRAAGQLPVNGRPLPLAARTSFRWERGALDVARLDARLLGGGLTGAGRVTPLAKVPRYAFKGAIAHLDLATLQRALAIELPATGLVQAQFDVQGKGFKTPEITLGGTVQARGALKRLAAGNVAKIPFSANARVRYAGRDLAIERLTGQVFGGDIEASGRIPPGAARGRLAISGRGRGIQLALVSGAFPLAPGPLAGQVDARIDLAGDQIAIAGVEARTLGGVVTASGRIALGKQASYDLNVSLRHIDLDAARRAGGLPAVPIQGAASATLRVAGSGSAFGVAGPIDVSGWALVPEDGAPRTMRFLPLEIDGAIAASGRSVRFTPLEIQLGGSAIAARGILNLDGSSDMRFTGRMADAAVISRVFGGPVVAGGDAQLAGKVTGTAGHLRFDAKVVAAKTAVAGTAFDGAQVELAGTLGRELAVDGRLAARGLVTPGATFTTLESPFTYRALATEPGRGTVRLAAIAGQIGKATLTGSASYAVGAQSYTVELQSHGLTVGDLGTLDPESVAALPADTAIDFAVQGDGSLGAPAADVDLKLAAFRHELLDVGPSALKVQLDGRRLALDGSLFGDQATIVGRVPVGRGAGQVDVRFNQVRLGPVFALIPAAARSRVVMPTGGLLSGVVHVEGPFLEPSRLEAAVDLAAFEIAYEDLQIANHGPLGLSYADRKMTVRSFDVRGGGTDLRVKGILGLGVASDLALEGTLNLALLEKLAPKEFSDASGRATIDGQLLGQLGGPGLAGSLTIRDCELETRNLPQPIRDLTASIRLAKNQLFLDQLRATLGNAGRIQASGGATLGTDYVPLAVNLQVDAHEVAIRVPGVEVVANADLAFVGRPAGGRLDGQIRVLEGEYTQDVDLTRGIAARRVAASRSAGAGGSPLDHPLLHDLALRVQVLAPGQFFVHNNIAQAELRGDLVVLGTASRPAVVGRAEVVEGKVTFQDRTYTLEEASVDFIDPERLTPYVHSVATSNIEGIDVTVHANGTPENLKLDLSSTPAMSQTDLLALIATGQTPAQLRESGTSIMTASNLLLNQVAGGVARNIADRGVVDVLSIRPGTLDPAATGGGNFTVGKRLNEKLMITYTQDIAGPPGRTPGRLMIFDYLLTDAVALKLEQDLGGNFNASARYRIPVR